MAIDTLSVSEQVRAVLEEARQGLDRLYEDQLVKVILFGSHARGGAHAESDVDLLVVLRGDFKVYDEIKRTSPLVMKLLLKYGVPLSLLHFPEVRYHDPYHPLMMNINEEGIEL